MSQAFMQDGILVLQCEWFARCTNGTLKAVLHPILGLVPACDRCIGLADVAPDKIRDIEVTS